MITSCTGLPLALAIVGARAQQTGFPLETVAAGSARPAVPWTRSTAATP